jgi:hypothetical protein
VKIYTASTDRIMYGLVFTGSSSSGLYDKSV